MIKALIFDLEGVVVDSERHWDVCSEVFLKRRGIAYDRDLIKPLLMGKSMEDGVLIWKKLYGIKGEVKKLAQERRDVVYSLYQDTNYHDGFLDFFNKIKNKYKIAVATGIERQFLKIFDKKLGISKKINGHVYAIEDIGFISKPSPDIYLHAAKKINVDPSVCVVFEDSSNGVAGAKSAGMTCVAITTSTRRSNLKEADIIIESWKDKKLQQFV